MTYLFYGDNILIKEERIEAIKSKVLPSPDAALFDYQSFHCQSLDSSNLKKSLLELPAMAKKRVVLLRNAEKLSDQNKKIILEFLEQAIETTILIIDSNNGDRKNAFIKKASKLVTKTERLITEEKLNVFDVTNAISSRKPAVALQVLNQLYDDGNHPLKIMPGLVWFWGKSKNRLSEERYKKGLMDFQEADLNIKRSRIDANYALEILVTKLCSLIA